MTETRPRPEYGEYATPEEQALAMGVPSPAAVEPVVEAAVEPVAVAASPVESALPTDQPAPRRWDRGFTIALLVLGAWTTFSGFATYSDLPYSLTQVYTLYGYDADFPDSAQASAFGLAINVVHPVLLILAFYFSTRSLRAGRVSFWIPLAAGAVATVVSTVLLVVLLTSDPGFVEFMTTQVGA